MHSYSHKLGCFLRPALSGWRRHVSIHCIVTHELNPCMPEAYVVDVCTCCFNVQISVLTAYGAYAAFAHAAVLTHGAEAILYLWLCHLCIFL